MTEYSDQLNVFFFIKELPGEVMKTSLIAIVLFASFQHAFAATDMAAQFKFTEKECHNLASELSTEAFDEAKDLNAKKPMEKFSAETVKYLDATKLSFSKDLNKLCDKKKDMVTFDDLYREESTCKETCKENLGVIKTPVLKIVEDINRTKEKSEAVCVSICEKDHAKMDAMKRGLAMAMKSKVSPEKAAPDCTGVVSVKGKGIDVKEFNMSDEMKNERIRKTTDAER